MRIEVRGDQEVAAKLDRLGERALDARALFEKIADDLTGDEARRFSSDGFGSWAPLKASTKKRKARSKDPGVASHATEVLVGTGTGRKALTERGAPGQLRDIGRTELRFGIKQPGAAYYMRFHQLGKGVPKRVVVQATATRRKAIRGQVRAWVIDGIVL